MSPEIYIASYGGSGTNLVADYIHRYKRVRTPEWESKLCHYGWPQELGAPRLCIVADPVLAWSSMKRRGLLEVNASKILGRTACSDELPFAMRLFLENWVAAKGIMVKYEHLWEHIRLLHICLGVPFDEFPAYRPRVAAEADDTPNEVRRLQEMWRALPSFQIK